MRDGGCEWIQVASDGEICDSFPMMNWHPHRFLYRLFHLFQLFQLFQTRCREIWNSFPGAFQGVDGPPEPVLGLAMTGGRGHAHG